MKRSMLAMLLIGALTAPVSAETRTYFGFQIGIGNAPPPPRVYFREPPDVVFVPETRVYVVQDDDYGVDMFRYGRFWYVTRGGYWYRARAYRGPFRVIDARYVPQAIYYVPAQHWKHHPRGGWPGRKDRDRDRGWDRGRGRSSG